MRTFFSLHSGAIKSNVPVGKLLKELQHVLDDVVKTIVVHLVSYKLDQVLVGSNDPSVHNV
jgi:hypothetical protein